MVKIIVEQCESGWRLRTGRGEPVGSRLLSVDPEPGKSLPDLTAAGKVFASKNDAVKMAFEWNLYLMWVQSKRRKTVKRGVE